MRNVVVKCVFIHICCLAPAASQGKGRMGEMMADAPLATKNALSEMPEPTPDPLNTPRPK